MESCHELRRNREDGRPSCARRTGDAQSTVDVVDVDPVGIDRHFRAAVPLNQSAREVLRRLRAAPRPRLEAEDHGAVRYRSHWQSHHEASTRARIGDRDIAAVRARDFASDRQAQA